MRLEELIQQASPGGLEGRLGEKAKDLGIRGTLDYGMVMAQELGAYVQTLYSMASEASKASKKEATEVMKTVVEHLEILGKLMPRALGSLEAAMGPELPTLGVLPKAVEGALEETSRFSFSVWGSALKLEVNQTRSLQDLTTQIQALQQWHSLGLQALEAIEVKASDTPPEIFKALVFQLIQGLKAFQQATKRVAQPLVKDDAKLKPRARPNEGHHFVLQFSDCWEHCCRICRESTCLSHTHDTAGRAVPA